MTRRELVNIFVQSKEVNGKAFEPDRPDPIVPFLIADLMYQDFTTATGGWPMVHEMKKLYTLWQNTYKKFNRSFFSCYPQDAWDDIIDLMDSLADHLAPSIEELHGKISDIIIGVGDDDRRRLTSLLSSYILAQFAQVAWGNVYKIASRYTGNNGRHTNRDLTILKETAFKMAVLWFRQISNGEVHLADLKPDGVFKRIADGITTWAKAN